MGKQSDGFWLEYRWWLIFFAFVVTLPAIAYFAWFRFNLGFEASQTPATWGEFGDFMGGVLNPFVAAAALLWLMRSVHIQKNELNETRSVMMVQAHTAEKQRFEGTFFALLSQLHQLSANINTIETMMSPIRRINGFFRNERRQERNFDETIDASMNILRSFGPALNTYFKVSHRLMLMIDEAPINRHLQDKSSVENSLFCERVEYANIFKSFLTEGLTALLAIYALKANEVEGKSLKSLLEKYEMFSDINTSSAEVFPELLSTLREAFEPEAFGRPY